VWKSKINSNKLLLEVAPMTKHKIQIITIPLAIVALLVLGSCAEKQLMLSKKEWRIEASKPYKGMIGMGYATICPASNPPPKEKRFLVYVPGIGGFLPKGDSGSQEPEDTTLGAEDVCAVTDHTSLIAETYGFHVVRVSFDDKKDYVQKNALVLATVIERLNKTYRLRDRDKIVVTGYSLGGLLGRYALASMEKDGIRHNVKLFVSVDSPQRGAYVPIGVQHMTSYLANTIKNEQAQEDLKLTFDRIATQQMLLYHYKAGNSNVHHTQLFNALYREELEGQLNGYPKAPHLRMVGITNGRGDGRQDLPKPGAVIIDWNYKVFSKNFDYSFNYKISSLDIKFNFTLKLDVKVYALASGKDSTVFRAEPRSYVDGDYVSVDDLNTITVAAKKVVKKNNPKTYPLIPNAVFTKIAQGIQQKLKQEKLPEKKRQYTKIVTIPAAEALEGVPGGRGNKTKTAVDILKTVKGVKLVGYYPDHTFIPAVSGLGLKDPYNTDVHSPDFKNTGIFNRIYAHDKNGGHLCCNDTKWVDEEIKLLIEGPGQ
jgi:hypothetical protein